MAEPARFFIGNQTAFSVPVADPFAFALDHDFDAFEFFPDGGPLGRGWAAGDVTAAERKRFRAAAAGREVRISVHAALESAPLEAPGRARLQHDLDLARDLGAQVVNIHFAAEGLDAYGRAALGLVELLEPQGITLALENTVSTGPDDINQLFARLQALDRPRALGIGLCLDIGHANLYQGTHNDYLAFLDQLGRHVPIVHVHLHENWGDADSHLPLFTGPARDDPSAIAGLLARLHRRGFHGSLILEQWPIPPSLLVDARDRLRALQEEAR